MDLEVVRTFVAIADTGSFKNAAERLHLTQSAISMRVRQLEERLGQPMFIRGRNGVTLTPAGQQFRPHADALLETWLRAQDEAGLPSAFRAAVTIGGQVSLWDHLLLRWLSWMRRELPDIAVRAEVGSANDLTMALLNGRLDVAVVYTPVQRANVSVEPLLTERLVLVETPDAHALPNRGLIFVDWGPEFRSSYMQRFAGGATPPVSVGLGQLGLQYILENGGSGYFPLRLVVDHLSEGTLQRSADTPEFTRPAYLAYPIGHDEPWYGAALDGLRAVAASL